MGSSILSVGDKVEIRLLKDVLNTEKTEGPIRVFYSQIHDISDQDIKVAMPIEKGKLILLPLEMVYEFCFYTKHGLYKCEGEIQKRYKAGNIYMVSVVIKSKLVKHQRRSFYRLACLLDVTCQYLEKEKEGLNTEINVENRDECFASDKAFKGIILDISGGGIKFTSDNQLEKESYACFRFRLELSDQERIFEVVGLIISSERIETERGPKYENRVRFERLSQRDQEAIVRYIFEAERKQVNKKKD